MLLKKRLVCGLLAVTTAMTNVAANFSPSYAAPRNSGIARNGVRNGKKAFNVVWNKFKQIYEIIAIPGGVYSTYQAAEAARNQLQQQKPQPQPTR